MKKPIVFCLLILPLVLVSQSYIGLRVGILTAPLKGELNHMRGSESVNYYPTPGFALILNTQISKVTHLGIDLQYDLYDVDHYNHVYAKGNGQSTTTQERYQYSYLSIYFYPQFNFGRKCQFYFNMGPSIKILTNSYVEGTSHYSPGQPGDSAYYKTYKGFARDDFAPVSFSFTSTIGVQYNVTGAWHVFADMNMILWPYPFNTHASGRVIDLKINIGFLYRFSNKRLKANPLKTCTSN